MNEQKILAAAIKDREAYEKIEPFVREGDFTEQAALVWRGIGEYYRRDRDCGSCDGEVLARTVGRLVTSDKHRKQFAEIVESLADSEVSASNVVHDFIAVKREAAGARLASELIAGRHNVELLEEYERWAEASDLEDAEDSDNTEVIRALPLTSIAEAYDPDALIKLWPPVLNKRLDGGLLRGHHVVVFARPEMGKTLFVVNAMVGFLRQGLRVLYIGNEEPLEDTALRIICRMTMQSKVDVLDSDESIERSYALAVERGYENMFMSRLYPGTPREIEDRVKDVEPDVVVIDQLRNVRMREDNYTQQLEKAATMARNIGKRHNALVVSVTQAGDSASGKAILEMGDVDSSNTGIPAQADVMIAIGATKEDEEMGRRVISLPKNKRSGDHGYFPVKLDVQRNKIEGFGND